MARDHDIGEAADVEGPVRTWALDNGWEVIKVGKDGWPDRLFLKAGRAVWIEFKRPGKEPSPRQYRKIKWLNDNGFEAYWFDNPKRAIRVLR